MHTKDRVHVSPCASWALPRHLSIRGEGLTASEGGVGDRGQGSKEPHGDRDPSEAVSQLDASNKALEAEVESLKADNKALEAEVAGLRLQLEGVQAAAEKAQQPSSGTGQDAGSLEEPAVSPEEAHASSLR